MSYVGVGIILLLKYYIVDDNLNILQTKSTCLTKFYWLYAVKSVVKPSIVYVVTYDMS